MPGEVPSVELSLKYIASSLKYDLLPTLKDIATSLSDIKNSAYLMSKAPQSPRPTQPQQQRQPQHQPVDDTPF